MRKARKEEKRARAREEKKRQERTLSPSESFMPSIEVNEKAAAATLPSKHPGVSRNPSIKTRQVKTIKQSRRSLAQKSTAKLDTLLTIVDDNR